MTIPLLNVLVALIDIMFGLGCAFNALAALIYVRWDHGFQRRLDIAFALLAGFLAWGALSSYSQQFVYVSDPSISVAYPLYSAMTFSMLLTLALLYVSLRRFTAALRRLLSRGGLRR